VADDPHDSDRRVDLDAAQQILVELYADIFEPFLRERYRREHEDIPATDGAREGDRIEIRPGPR
jgi:hypothetical protein